MVFFFAPNLSNIVLVFHRILDLKARGWIYILAPFYFSMIHCHSTFR